MNEDPHYVGKISLINLLDFVLILFAYFRGHGRNEPKIALLFSSKEILTNTAGAVICIGEMVCLSLKMTEN